MRTHVYTVCMFVCVCVVFGVLFVSVCFGACKREMYDNSQRYKEGNKRAIMKFGEEKDDCGTDTVNNTLVRETRRAGNVFF